MVWFLLDRCRKSCISPLETILSIKSLLRWFAAAIQCTTQMRLKSIHIVFVDVALGTYTTLD